MNNSWPLVPLGEAITHRKELIRISDFESYKRCRVQLHAKGIALRDVVPGAEIKTKEQQVCRAGEFLVAEIDAKVGGFGVVPDELDGSIVSSHYFLFEVNQKKLDGRFLDYFTRTPFFRDQVAARGSTNYAAIRPHHVLHYQIPLPPLPEQRRIVARIETLAEQIQEARTLRQSCVAEAAAWWPNILREALVGKNQRGDELKSECARNLLAASAKRNADAVMASYNNAHPQKPKMVEDGPVALPSHWVWTTVGSVLTHLVDCINDTPDFAEYETGLIGLKSTNIRPYQLDLSRTWFMTRESFVYWNRREKPQCDDIVLTREAPMGNACLVPADHEFCLTQRLMLLRADRETILPKLLLHYLNSPYFQEQVDDKCRGLTAPHIRVQDVPNFILPLPPMDQQHRIVTELDALQAQVDALNKLQSETAAELDALLPSILDKAFKGEL